MPIKQLLNETRQALSPPSSLAYKLPRQKSLKSTFDAGVCHYAGGEVVLERALAKSILLTVSPIELRSGGHLPKPLSKVPWQIFALNNLPPLETGVVGISHESSSVPGASKLRRHCSAASHQGQKGALWARG